MPQVRVVNKGSVNASEEHRVAVRILEEAAERVKNNLELLEEQENKSAAKTTRNALARLERSIQALKDLRNAASTSSGRHMFTGEGERDPFPFEVVEFKKAIGNSIVPPLMVDAWQELLRQGWTDESTIGMYSDSEAVAAVDPDGRPLGCIVFTHHEWSQTTWIYTSYVRPSMRRCGLYKAMYSVVRQAAIAKGMRRIESGIHRHNIAMVSAARSAGRNETGIATFREEL